MTYDATRYPVDVRALNKGDYISPETIEAWCGFKRDSKEYRFKLMEFQKILEHALEAELKPATVKCELDGIRILTDAEASVYNHARQAQQVRSIKKCHIRQLLVDTQKLDPEQMNKHLAHIRSSAFLVTAISDAKRKLKRNGQDTPKLEA